MESRVSDRGQITIDREARRRLGVEPGMVAYQRVVDGHLEVTFLPALHRKSAFGMLHDANAQAGFADGSELERLVMEALAEKHERLDMEGG